MQKKHQICRKKKHQICRKSIKYARNMQKYMQKYVKIRTVLAKTCHRNMHKNCIKYAIICKKLEYAIICTNMHKYAFYMQKYMQKYVKIRTVSAKTCRNMQEICKNMQKYAFYMQKYAFYMQKYAKICKNICKNIRVYVFAYGTYICTHHFADVKQRPHPTCQCASGRIFAPFGSLDLELLCTSRSGERE